MRKAKKQKQNSYDPKSVELPNSVDVNLWNQFVDMRSANRKPLTENAVKLILKKLEAFGELANQSLENSIIGNYQGVFLPKPQLGQPNNSGTPQEPSYFAESFEQTNQSNIIDVTPEYALAGGNTHA